MSGAFDAIVDIGLDAVLDFAPDIGSLVTDLGTEFLDVGSFTSFEIPGFDVSSLGGFDIVGSFAGDAGWFDTFNPGSILDSIPSISDFSLPSLTSSFPSLSSLNTNSLVSSAASSFGISPSIASSITKVLSNPSIVSAGASALGINPAIVSAGVNVLKGGSPVTAAASALGINPSIVSAATNVLNGGSPVAAGAAALGINPSIATSLTAKATSLFAVNPNATNAVDAATGLPINTPREVDAYGLNILSVAESKATFDKFLTPGLVNSLSDPSTAQKLTYDTALASRDELAQTIKSYTDAIANSEQAIQSNNANISDIEAELADPYLPDDRRLVLEEYLQANYENNAIQQNLIESNRTVLSTAVSNLAADQTLITQTDATSTRSPVAVTSAGLPAGVTQQYTSAYDPETGTWSVYDNITSTTVSTGLTEQEALLAEQELNITQAIQLNPNAAAVSGTATQATQASVRAVDNAIDSAIATNARSLTDQLRNQASIRDMRQNKAQASDWRVRLRLAPNSQYLYKDTSAKNSVLAPLFNTDGVIFPYTPAIDTAYKANYDQYDLTHSNYRGYFYKNSYVDAINVRAQFTAQDTQEANYLLAVIHFFRSATKMFYGKDTNAGAPPPLVYLNGYGDYQFNEHPCVISQFNYQLPSDVDYIRAQDALKVGTNMLANRIRNPISSNPLSYSVNRLLNSNLLPGALDFRPSIASNLPTGEPTYVPTKMEISITLLPIQSRKQISNNFSVKEFAQGNLLKGGYW
jgi:hypothetical protein